MRFQVAYLKVMTLQKKQQNKTRHDFIWQKTFQIAKKEDFDHIWRFSCYNMVEKSDAVYWFIWLCLKVYMTCSRSCQVHLGQMLC